MREVDGPVGRRAVGRLEGQVGVPQKKIVSRVKGGGKKKLIKRDPRRKNNEFPNKKSKEEKGLEKKNNY